MLALHRLLEADLPLRLIVAEALAQDAKAAFPLSLVSRAFQVATRNVLYRSIVLPDLDLLLQLFEWESAHANTTSVCGRSLLKALALSKSSRALVKKVVICDAVDTSLPMHTDSFIRLLLEFPNLESIKWQASRPFPNGVDLTSLSSLKTLYLSSKNQQRTDAKVFALVPAVLMDMKASFNTEGVRVLQTALPRLDSLKHIHIHDTPSLDDDVLIAMADHCPHLSHLTLRRISGTKVGDKGIRYIFENALQLGSLSMIDFEGRLSANLWFDIDEELLPPGFYSLVLVYTDTQHSWTLDHLKSLPSFVDKCATLSDLWIEKQLPDEDRSGRVLSDDVGPLPDSFCLALFNAGRRLRRLCLDMFLLSLAQLQCVTDGALDLTQLQVRVDAPFFQALTHSALATLPNMRKLSITVATQYQYSLEGSSRSILDDKASPEKQVAQLKIWADKPPQMASTFFVREAKRFVKRGKNRLTELESYGIGSFGNWQIQRIPSLSIRYLGQLVEPATVARSTSLLDGLPDLDSLKELLAILEIAPREVVLQDPEAQNSPRLSVRRLSAKTPPSQARDLPTQIHQKRPATKIVEESAAAPAVVAPPRNENKPSPSPKHKGWGKRKGPYKHLSPLKNTRREQPKAGQVLFDPDWLIAPEEGSNNDDWTAPR